MKEFRLPLDNWQLLAYLRPMNKHRHYCPFCTGSISFGDCTGESGLYLSHGVSELCERCFLLEEAITDEEGTNNIPDLLEKYRINDWTLNRR